MRSANWPFATLKKINENTLCPYNAIVLVLLNKSNIIMFK